MVDRPTWMERKKARPRDVRATLWNGQLHEEAVMRRKEKTGGMETRREEEAVAMCGVEKHALLEARAHVLRHSKTSGCAVLNRREGRVG